MSDEARMQLREHRDRLAAMVEDDGDTWDLSDNDRAACRAGAEAIAEVARLREALVKVVAHTGYMPGADRELLAGLLASIDRIARAALSAGERKGE
jgi:hypothetical protein